MADIKYIITVDEKGASKAIQDFDKSIGNLAKTTGKEATPAVSGFHKAYGDLTATIAVGMAVYAVASKAIGTMTGFMKDCIQGAIEEEQSEHNLRIALEVTGHEAQGNALHFLAYAQQLMAVTKYTHEDAEATQALFLQMGLGTDKIDEATRGALGMASVFHIDLQSATQLVGKAIEGNVDRFTRYIPQLKNCATDAEKVALIHKKMGEWFGAARGEINTFGGQVSQLNKYWNELKESLGKLVIENKGVSDFIYVLTKGIKSLREEVESFQSGKKGITLWDFLGPVAFMKAISSAVSSIADKLREAEKPLHTIPEYSKAWQDFWGYLAKTSPGLAKALENVAKGTKDIGDDGKKSGQAIKAQLLPPFRDLSKVIAGFNLLAFLGGLKDMPGYFNAVLPPARDMSKVLKEVLGEIKLVSTWSKKSFDAMVENWQASMDKIKGAWDILHTGLTGVFDQAQRNREIALDNEYKKRLEYIMTNVTDEEERQKAIEALEAEYQIKRSSAQREAAKSAKAVALMEAIVNVAAGVTKALSALPPPFNIALAAITAALGAIQIALIRSQPIPLAKGAIFRKPTKLFSESGASYEVGEGGEPEVLAPLSKIRRMAGAETGPIYLSVYIGAEKLEAQVIKIVNRSIGLKRIKAYAT